MNDHAAGIIHRQRMSELRGEAAGSVLLANAFDRQLGKRPQRSARRRRLLIVATAALLALGAASQRVAAYGSIPADSNASLEAPAQHLSD